MPAWTLTTLVGLLALLVFIYAIHWVMLPFVIAGVIGYVCTPLIDRLAHRMPRALASVLVFIGILAAAAGLGSLGLPPLLQELKGVATDFSGSMERLAKSVIGEGSVNLFGQTMSAAYLAKGRRRDAGENGMADRTFSRRAREWS